MTRLRTRSLGPEGFKQFFSALRSAFPDLNIEVEKMVADDDHVAIAYTVSGTHDGDFVGVGPTGKKITARDADRPFRGRQDR